MKQNLEACINCEDFCSFQANPTFSKERVSFFPLSIFPDICKMGTENGDSAVKDMLKTLCQNNGWSYAVIWFSDHQNPTMLTMRNAYNEDQMGILIDDMLLQVHVLGTGIVGQAVSSMDNRWIFLNDDCGGEDWKNPNVLQDDKDMHYQFSYGIKTIALIPLDAQGIVQFGSTQKIYETAEFVNQAKQLLWMIGTSNVGFDSYENTVSSSSNSDFDEVLASLMSWTEDSDLPELLLDPTFGSLDLPELSEFGSDYENGLTFTENDPFDHSFGCLSSSNAPFPEPDINQVVQNLINAPISNQDFSAETSIVDSFCSVPNDGFSNWSNDIFNGLAFGLPGQNTSLLTDTVTPLRVKNGLDEFLSNERMDSILSNEEKEFFSFGISNRKLTYSNTTMSAGSSGFSPKKSKEDCLRNVNKMGKQESKPKPKDRVQVRKRIEELRKLVPKGGKISIDSLLSETVKHLLFLEGVTKYAEAMKKAEELKNIGVLTYDKQSTIEPVYVKNLNAPGQILIEIHLEENDFFTDIVEIIQGFGMIILKGSTEKQGNKLWACFIVEAEANRYITNQHIYISLRRFLNQKASLCNMNVAIR